MLIRTRNDSTESAQEPAFAARLDQRAATLEAEVTELQNAAEQAHSLQLVTDKMESFAALVRDQLDEADRTTRRDLIRTRVRRIEVDDRHVQVVVRIGPNRRTGQTHAGCRTCIQDLAAGCDGAGSGSA